MHETGSDSEKNCNTGFIHVAEPEPPPPFWQPLLQLHLYSKFFLLIFYCQLFLPQGKGGSALRPRLLLYVQYWQDAGIRAPVAATPARCAINELHTSL